MRVLIAFDKFKGSLTARQASEAVARGLSRNGASPNLEICPIADGGEGFTDAVLAATSGTWCEAIVHDAQGRPRTARYGLIQENGVPTAVMEMSAASGLAIVADLPLQPATASTFGTGEMMLHALGQGARRIVIGIGGSATNDGGSGMAAALGWKFLDHDGHEIGDLPAGLKRLHKILRPSRPFQCEVVVACDVTNPLLGEFGATRVYGPQKGVQDFSKLEACLEKLADVMQRDWGCDHREAAGAGAAGGLGFGLMSFCGAQLRSGFDLVADLTRLRERVAEADIVITGEGRLDAQTLHGKGPAGVAHMAREMGKRIVGIGGLIQDREAVSQLFDHVVQAKPEQIGVKEAMARAAELLEEATVREAHAIMGSAPR